MSTKHPPRFRSFADAAEKKVWIPVINEKPRYENFSEKQRWEQAAADNPIQEGESRAAWSERVAAAARPVADRELPVGDREDRSPGEDG